MATQTTREHPVAQEINSITLTAQDHAEYGFSFVVGGAGITRIEATTKSGLHADIPYVRVWTGELCLAEYCQHNIFGVTFSDRKTPEATS